MSVAGLVGSGPLLLAIPVAAAAGAVTFLSPCCLPLVPGYLSYITGMSGADARQADPAEAAPASGEDATSLAVMTQGGEGTTAVSGSGALVGAPGGMRDHPGFREAERGTSAASSDFGEPPEGPSGFVGTSRRAGMYRAEAAQVRGPGGLVSIPRKSRAVAGTMLFVLGFSAVFATYGTVFGGVGQLVHGHGQQALTQVLGALTIVLGLLFAGAFDRFTFAGRIIRPTVVPRAGLAGAPLLGVLFGVGWSPCIGPTLSAVMALSTVSGTAARGAFLAFVYGLGLGIPFLLVSVAFTAATRVLAFFRRNARLVTRIGGAMLVIVGVLEVTGAWTAAMTWLQAHWAGDYQLPL